jgi:hypothetical protein
MGLPGKQETRHAGVPGFAGLTASRLPARLASLEVNHGGVALSAPIPVLLEPTRSLRENLLTPGTVLGQPH